MARIKKDMIEFTKNDVKEVETWNGGKAPREECKRIDGKYYQVDVDCFLIPNSEGELKWTRRNNGRVAYDFDMQKWDLIKRLREKPEYVEGIINNKGDRGYFTFNPYNNVTIVETLQEEASSGTLCINKQVAEELGYMEYFATGCYVPTKGYNPSQKKKLQQKDIYKYKNIKKLAYNADDNNTHFLSIIKEYNKHKPKIRLEGLVSQAGKLFGNYSWGIEYESINGFIPNNLLGPLGIVPLKDGSLRLPNGTEPYEYTTIPLSGDTGLQTVKMQCEELTRRCELNEKCSMHIHIGSLNKRTPEFVVALYKLCFNIQNEVFDMFPHYKTHPENYGMGKNYCQKLPDLQLTENFKQTNLTPKDAKTLVKSAFDKIYWWASDQTVRNTDDTWNLNTRRHPKGEMDKWNFSSRYVWCNLHNYLFSHRGTVEWRCHTPTFNFIKVSNWLFITSAIIQFAEQFTHEILKDEVTYNLETILYCYKNYFFKSFYENDYSINVSQYLVDYVKFRKECMKKDFENGDGMGNSIEFKKDAKFEFSSSELKSIY